MGLTMKQSVMQTWISSSVLAIFICVSATFISPAAYADNVFLLQLGAYNSNKLATQKWDEVKAKNEELVGNLGFHVSEVSLPPDNTVTYRPQIGPLTSHDQAATLCSQLKQRSVECFVVETALLTSDDLPPVKTVTKTETVTTTVEESKAPLMEDKSPVQREMESSMQTVAPATPAQPSINEQALAPAPQTTIVEKIPDPLPAAPPMAAPETIVLVEPTPAPAIAPPAPVEPVMERVTTTQTETTTVVAADTTPKMDSRMVPGREPKFLTVPKSMQKQTVVTQTESTTVEAPSAIASSETAVTQEPRPGFFGRLFSSSPRKPVNANTTGDVKVAEAIRVPLSSGRSSRKPVVADLPSLHGLGGTPSSTPSGKVYWAQLNYFPSEEAARGFYNEFRADYPQFSDGVRMRVTRPYTSTRARVSMRMGPFAGTQDARTICIAASQRGVSCGLMRDIGASTAANAPRERRASTITNMQSQTLPDNLVPKYWVQLGSYRSADDAWDKWGDMQAQYKQLKRAHATVTNPPISSSARSTYRLRAGPYVSESSANNLCNGLSGRGISCLVVDDK